MVCDCIVKYMIVAVASKRVGSECVNQSSLSVFCLALVLRVLLVITRFPPMSRGSRKVCIFLRIHFIYSLNGGNKTAL